MRVGYKCHVGTSLLLLLLCHFLWLPTSTTAILPARPATNVKSPLLLHRKYNSSVGTSSATSTTSSSSASSTTSTTTASQNVWFETLQGDCERPSTRETRPLHRNLGTQTIAPFASQAGPPLLSPTVSALRSIQSSKLYIPATAKDGLSSHLTTTPASHPHAASVRPPVNKTGSPMTPPFANKSQKQPLPEIPLRSLTFWENMICGAVSRSIAQTAMQPANTMKTILQSARGQNRQTFFQLLHPSNFKMLTRGAGANFLLSVPHGAVNFAVLEFARKSLHEGAMSIPFFRRRIDSIGPALDFASSAVSTLCCSIISTPQMMITDNIMAGNYKNLVTASQGLYQQQGIMGFYSGWWPGLVGKIPSYALTWTFFQQFKRIRANMVPDRQATHAENAFMGCLASALTVCIMIPLDTVKTRLVTQMAMNVITGGVPYKGIIDCAVRMVAEEGIPSFYRGLAPRLLSTVPMIGIQFGVYEAMKSLFLHGGNSFDDNVVEETVMEVAASAANPFPAPQFRHETTTTLQPQTILLKENHHLPQQQPQQQQPQKSRQQL